MQLFTASNGHLFFLILLCVHEEHTAAKTKGGGDGWVLGFFKKEIHLQKDECMHRNNKAQLRWKLNSEGKKGFERNQKQAIAFSSII